LIKEAEVWSSGVVVKSSHEFNEGKYKGLSFIWMKVKDETFEKIEGSFYVRMMKRNNSRWNQFEPADFKVKKTFGNLPPKRLMKRLQKALRKAIVNEFVNKGK
jgi:hypothetical protein